MGSQVLVPFRGSEDCHRHLKLMGDLGQIVPMKYNPIDESSVKQRLMLLSILLATVLKPAVMIGTEDWILNPWAHLAKKYGFLPLIGDGSTKIQPVYVIDVASAIVAALKDNAASLGKVYELGGPEIFTTHQLAELMFDVIREYSRYVKIPFSIAKAMATAREVLQKKVPMPTSTIFNMDLIEAFSVDTVVYENAITFVDLGIAPSKLKGYSVEFLLSYRKGGPQYDSTVSEKVTPQPWS